MHLYVGDMDNHYLNLAVYLLEEETAKLTNPKPNFTFEVGRPMKPHGWQPMTNAEMGADDGPVPHGASDPAVACEPGCAVVDDSRPST